MEEITHIIIFNCRENKSMQLYQGKQEEKIRFFVVKKQMQPE